MSWQNAGSYKLRRNKSKKPNIDSLLVICPGRYLSWFLFRIRFFSDVCSTKHHSTWRTAASTPQTLLVASICRVAGNTVPQYMTDCCIHTSDTARRQHLRSAGCHQLFVPRHRRSMFGRRAFSVAGPSACNSLPDYLRDPSSSADSFRRDLKTFLFSFY